jgi:RHH-type transcriptional regulator, rel operon repressor / antitoxin RelB
MTIQTAIQLPEEVYERLKSLADSIGQTPADFISQAILEHMEDLEDVILAEEALRKLEAGESRTYTLEEVSRELGLDD